MDNEEFVTNKNSRFDMSIENLCNPLEQLVELSSSTSQLPLEVRSTIIGSTNDDEQHKHIYLRILRFGSVDETTRLWTRPRSKSAQTITVRAKNVLPRIEN